MKNVTVNTIMPSVDLTCISTDIFKTGFISINFITPLSDKTVSKNALLPGVLRCGTSEHPDMNAIAAVLDDLYGARIEPIVRKKGEALCVGLYASFVDDDFVPSGEHILERTVSLMGEIILSPATRGGILLEKYVESEKNKLIDEINTAKNDKISYALQRMLEVMCKNEPYGISSRGTEDSVKAITNRSLTKHYKELISSSKIEVIYCGSADEHRVSAALLDSFSALPRVGEPEPVETTVIFEPEAKEPVTVYDEMDVAQGKLTMGFRLGKSMLSPNYPALTVFNAAFGGSVTSKLFMNVREKLSLCYYASSLTDKLKGIVAVYSGVEFENFSKAYNEIMAQLDEMRSGNISDYELESAKKYAATAIRSKADSAGGIEDFYLEASVSGVMLSPDEFARLIENVAKDDIVKIANDVILDTVHYITSKGGDTHED